MQSCVVFIVSIIDLGAAMKSIFYSERFAVEVFFSNGWSDAPHCWRSYLSYPVRYDRNPVQTTVSIFGFFFIWFRGYID